MGKKLKFGYDLANLTEFVNEQKLSDLLTKSVFSGRTAELIPVQTGIKYKDVLNLMDTDVLFQDGSTCALTASGETTFDQVEIAVGKIALMKDFCPRDLENFWTSIDLPAGSYYDSMAFAAAWEAHQSALVSAEVEKMLWQSNVLSGTGNFAFFDGLNTQIDAAVGVINGNAGTGWTPIAVGTGILTTNVISIFNNMVNQLPDALAGQGDVKFFCGWDTFRKLLQAYFTLNNFHYGDAASGSPYQTGEIVIPTFGLTVVALHGLTGTNRIHLMRESNARIGTDLENDFEQYEIFYDQTADLIYYRLRAKLGTQVVFGNEIVTFKLVP
jgi:hypothetical protein